MFNTTTRRAIALIALVWAIAGIGFLSIVAGTSGDLTIQEFIGFGMLWGLAPSTALIGLLWVTAIEKED